MDISDWRKTIDELDEQIVALISRRAEAAHAIGELKRKHALPVYEPGREQAAKIADWIGSPDAQTVAYLVRVD